MNGHLVIDCDPGTDDALALFLLSRAQVFPALCIATMGNNASAIVVRNLYLWTRYLGESPTLAHGADQRYDGTVPNFGSYHGEDGLGGLAGELQERFGPPGTMGTLDEAADRICAMDAATYIAIGPLTTLALLLDRRPEIAVHLSRVLVMGGGLAAFNFDGVAEYNFGSDPDAVARVFASGLDLTLFPLDLTYVDALLGRGDIQSLARTGRHPEVVRLLEANLASAVSFGEAEDSAVLHDMMPCIDLLHPDAFDKEDMRLGIGEKGAIFPSAAGRLVHVAKRARQSHLVYETLRPFFTGQ